MDEALRRLGLVGLVPVISIEDAASVQPLARALINGGLPCAEVTFRTAAAEDAIRAMAAAFPEMLVGAGTVLSVAQAETALTAGAKFIITPGFDAAVVDWCHANDMPVVPGVMTPTEILMALHKGLDVLKFFPAEAAGGIAMLKAVSGPYRDVKFIPTGGITPANLADYLRLPNVHACGGSWLATKELVKSGRFDEITRLVAEAVMIVQRTRKAAGAAAVKPHQ